MDVQECWLLPKRFEIDVPSAVGDEAVKRHTRRAPCIEFVELVEEDSERLQLESMGAKNLGQHVQQIVQAQDELWQNILAVELQPAGKIEHALSGGNCSISLK